MSNFSIIKPPGSKRPSGKLSINRNSSPASGLVVLLPLISNAKSLTGRNNAVWTGVEQWASDSTLFSVAQFGGSRYLTVTNNASLQLTTDWTYAWWMNKADLLDCRIFSQYNNGAGGQLEIIYGGGTKIVMQVPNVANVLFSNSILNSTGVWYHCVSTRAGSDWRFYLNGVLDASTTNSTTQSAASTDLNIGYSAQSGEFYNGQLADIRIYNRALTAAEVLNLYTAQTRWDLYNSSRYINLFNTLPAANYRKADLFSMMTGR